MRSFFANRFPRLFQAHHGIQSEADRRQVGLFLIANSVILVVAAVGTVNAYLSMSRGRPFAGLMIMTGITSLLGVALVLGRSRNYVRGILLTTILMSLFPYTEIILKAGLTQPGIAQPGASGPVSFLSSLAWLGPMLIFAGMLLPLPALRLVVTFNIFATALITLYFSAGNWMRAVGPIGLIVALGGLVLLARAHSQRLERLRLREIEAARDELEQRVMERTDRLARANAELQVARQAAEEAFRHRSSYLAEVSHDLRTPLTIILGFSEMLNYQAQARGEEETSRHLSYIETSARYLVDLSRNLIDLARLERGDTIIEWNAVWVPALVEEVLLLAQPLVAAKQNRLSGDTAGDLGEIVSDATCLRQILINLLSNAGKFTSGGEVVLRARRSQDDGRDWLVFEVEDTGIGMTPAQVKALFQPYPPSYRATRDHYTGSGLGLAIAHLLVTRLGGTIAARSRVNHGSTFTVRLPVYREPPE